MMIIFHAASASSLCGGVAKISGRNSSRNCRRAGGIPFRFHSLTEGDLTLHSRATANVPPIASMISESVMHAS
jgi:hypothetical protein